MSIPNEAVEAAHKAWREQAAQDGSIFEYNLRAALEAAAPYIKSEAIDKAADDADGLGMSEIPVHSLRFRAECYRNMGTNLHGGHS